MSARRSFILIGAITAIRFVYFGDVVPNTFHSKPGGVRLAIENGYGFLMGQNSNVAFPITGWLAIPVLLLGYRRLRRASPAAADMLAAICGAGLMFAVYSPPDWTALPRYFAPYLPAALIFLWAGWAKRLKVFCLAAMRAKPQAACRGTGGARPLAADCCLAADEHLRHRGQMSQMETFPGYVLAGKNLVGPALWMRDHLPADATIATRRIGASGVLFAAERVRLHLRFGRSRVARLVAGAASDSIRPPIPIWTRLWRARAPEYFLEDSANMDSSFR